MRLALISILCTLFINTSFSQEKDSVMIDSLSVQANAILSIATRDEQPLWITSNKRGILSDNINNAILMADLSYVRKIGKNFKSTTKVTPVARNAGFYDFEKGGSVFLAEYFSQFNYHQWYIRAGAKSYPISQYGGNLSSGSLSQTQNARGIPMISAGADYFSFPFTKGYLQFKGELSHGWLEKSRTVTDAWIHQKNAYIKVGHPKLVNLVIGLTHNALWGGKRGNQDSKFSWNAYKSVFFGAPAEDNSILGGADFYVYGSHLGTVELALNFQVKSFKGTFSIQRPWEDSQQISRHQMLDIFFRRNKDGIIGLKLETPHPIFRNITIEHIHTSHQGGPGLPDPPSGVDPWKDDRDGCKYNHCYEYTNRENYYNNYIFHGGWSYYNRSIGTPLYTHQKRVVNILKGEDLGEVYGRNTIYNNRVDGFHIGVSGKIKATTSYQFKYTYTKNYGNYYAEFGAGYKYKNGKPTGWSRYGEPYFFKNGIHQSYALAQVNHELTTKPVKFSVALGVDFGGIYNSFGALLGVAYTYESIRRKKK